MNCSLTIMWKTGFIAAACGQLDAVLQQSSNVGNSSLSKAVGTDISAIKPYQNGTATRPAYRPECVYGNGNGNGLHY